MPIPIPPSRCMLAAKPYLFCFAGKDGLPYRIAAIGYWAIYSLNGGMFVRARNNFVYMAAGDVLTGYGEFEATGDTEFFFVGADLEGSGKDYHHGVWEQYYQHECEVVTKPWGREVWLHKCHVSLKLIEINAGHQTSLQYHRRKHETNVLWSGTATLMMGREGHAEHTRAVEIMDFCPKEYINVAPLTVHRICARTDIVLVEASTPDLDDVVRLHDDTNRPDGRIESEHQ